MIVIWEDVDDIYLYIFKYMFYDNLHLSFAWKS